MYGEEHPDVATGLGNMVELFSKLGHHDDAVASGEAAVSIYLKACGEGHRLTIFSLGKVAMSKMRRGDDGAREAVQNTIAQFTSSPHSLPLSHDWVKRLPGALDER